MCVCVLVWSHDPARFVSAKAFAKAFRDSWCMRKALQIMPQYEGAVQRIMAQYEGAVLITTYIL